MKFIVPKEISSEIKMNKYISVIDLFILVLYGIVVYMFENLVYIKLQIPYYIFAFSVGVWLVLGSFDNKGMKNYKSIYLSIIRFKETYHRINIEED